MAETLEERKKRHHQEIFSVYVALDRLMILLCVAFLEITFH